MFPSGKIISLSVWLMILFNLLLSFGAVWHFQRMNPEIQSICDRNVVSLNACEIMLRELTAKSMDQDNFQAALQIAAGNITEQGEEENINTIKKLFEQLKNGDATVKIALSEQVLELHRDNQEAITAAADRAQRLRQAGAWAIVLLTLIFFVLAIYFEQRMRRALLAPLEEMSGVLEANARGDRFRRCQAGNVSQDMKTLFQLINIHLKNIL